MHHEWLTAFSLAWTFFFFFVEDLFPNNKTQMDYSYYARHYYISVLPQFTFSWRITEFPELHQVYNLQYCEMKSALLGFLLKLFGIFFKKKLVCFNLHFFCLARILSLFVMLLATIYFEKGWKWDSKIVSVLASCSSPLYFLCCVIIWTLLTWNVWYIVILGDLLRVEELYKGAK